MTLRLHESLVSEADIAARGLSVSRSQLIRMALEAYLEAARRAKQHDETTTGNEGRPVLGNPHGNAANRRTRRDF